MERSDTCAVPAACGGRAVVAIELAQALLEKFVAIRWMRFRRNRDNYLAGLRLLMPESIILTPDGEWQDHVGQLLAARLGYRFQDLDALWLSRQERVSIRSLLTRARLPSGSVRPRCWQRWSAKHRQSYFQPVAVW